MHEVHDHEQSRHHEASSPWVRDAQCLRSHRQKYAAKLKSHQTKAEKALSSAFERIGLPVLPQHIIHPFIIDFLYGHAIIEIDGMSHDSRAAVLYDAQRTAYLNKLGYDVLRATNNDVAKSPHSKAIGLRDDIILLLNKRRYNTKIQP